MPATASKLHSSQLR